MITFLKSVFNHLLNNKSYNLIFRISFLIKVILIKKKYLVMFALILDPHEER